MRISLLKVAGGAAIVVASFLATNFILESLNTAARRDAQRIADIQKIRDAAKSYRRANSKFPANLKVLVDSRHLDAIPSDPLWAGTKKGYQYYSDEINNFGLLVWLEEQHGKLAAGKSCRTGVGTRESELWGPDTPECPF